MHFLKYRIANASKYLFFSQHQHIVCDSLTLSIQNCSRREQKIEWHNFAWTLGPTATHNGIMENMNLCEYTLSEMWTTAGSILLQIWMGLSQTHMTVRRRRVVRSNMRFFCFHFGKNWQMLPNYDLLPSIFCLRNIRTAPHLWPMGSCFAQFFCPLCKSQLHSSLLSCSSSIFIAIRSFLDAVAIMGRLQTNETAVYTSRNRNRLTAWGMNIKRKLWCIPSHYGHLYHHKIWLKSHFKKSQQQQARHESNTRKSTVESHNYMVVLIIRWCSVNLMSTKHENRDAYSLHKFYKTQNKLRVFSCEQRKTNEGVRAQGEREREMKKTWSESWCEQRLIKCSDFMHIF